MIEPKSGLAILLACAALSFNAPVFSIGMTLAQAASVPASAGNDPDKAKLIDLWLPGDPGQRMNIRGRVTALDGTPVAGASIYIRQADGNGEYIDRYSATIESDHKGRFQFGSVVPGQYYGVKHVHLWVTHEAHQSLDTEILFKGDPNLADADAPNAIFLEEATVNDETILYGRFDIMLVPD